MSAIVQDLRYGVRMLGQSPSVTAIALLSLALGIGANTTIFTLINGLFLTPLPVHRPAELVSVYGTHEQDGSAGGLFNGFLPTSYLNYVDFRDRSEIFSGLLTYTFFAANLSRGGEPEQVPGLLVSDNYFDVLGVQPGLGREFSAEEGVMPGSSSVVVLGDGLWRRRYGADPAILGKTILLNGQSFTVIGVAPVGFQGTDLGAGIEVWVPLSLYKQLVPSPLRELFEHRGVRFFNIIGRLKPDVSLAQALAALQTLAEHLRQEHPGMNKGRGATVVPLQQAVLNPNQRGDFVLVGGVLMAMVGVVLLIACVNLANLLLARATARKRELAIRLSMGASRGRLVRQLLTESLLLSVLGGALGLAVAVWCRDLLWSFRPPFLPENAIALPIDEKVLLFTLAIAVGTGLLFGLAPAWQAARAEPVSALKSVTGIETGGRRLQLRHLLVILQMALSLVALAGAAVFLQSLWNAQRIDLGFQSDRLVMLSVNPGSQGYDEGRGRIFYREVLQRVSSLPGIEATALFQSVPLVPNGPLRRVFRVGDDIPEGESGLLMSVNVVSAGGLGMLGIPLLRGREFTDADRPGTLKVAVVNAALAERLWPGEEVIGRRFRFSLGEDVFEIVGVSRNAKVVSIGEEAQPHLYLPMEQEYSPGLTLVARSSGAPETVLGSLRQTVQELEPDLPLTNLQEYSAVLGAVLWAPRMGAALLGAFGLLALALAGGGLYGVMAYLTGRRTREIGIRIALGARPRDVLRMLLGQGMGLAVAGVVLGMAVAWGLARLVASLLYGTQGADPLLLGGLAVLLGCVAGLASYLPARKALQVPPMTALRSD